LGASDDNDYLDEGTENDDDDDDDEWPFDDDFNGEIHPVLGQNYLA
jgi:hypothetical protein